MVKTRLIPFLSGEGAARLQRAMTEDLLEKLSKCFGAGHSGSSGSGGIELELRLAGGSPAGLLVPPSWKVASQGEGDLGDRMARALTDAVRRGFAGLVLIGSDVPLMPCSLIESAFAALRGGNAAVAPAEDGGYVLIALDVEHGEPGRLRKLFRGIPWGTGAVLESTRKAAAEAGLDLAELDSHWDVDRPADLRRLAARIASASRTDQPRRTARFLSSRAGFRTRRPRRADRSRESSPQRPGPAAST